jgi:hypothetical protein
MAVLEFVRTKEILSRWRWYCIIGTLKNRLGCHCKAYICLTISVKTGHSKAVPYRSTYVVSSAALKLLHGSSLSNYWCKTGNTGHGD